MLHKISTPILIAILIYHGYHYYVQYSMNQALDTYAQTKGYTSKTHHQKPRPKPEVVKVTNDIYVATGFALGNSIMVIGETGVVIIDTTESLTQARLIAKEFRNITDKPVVGVIYTHNHFDHVQGTEAFLEYSTNRENIQIWAHHTLTDIYFHSTRRLTKAHFYRGMHQFGVFLPEGVISAGIGTKLELNKDLNTRLVLPNRLLYEEKKEISIAGIKLMLMHVPGETDDTVCVYWESRNALIGTDNLYKAFPNLYAIRGTTFRSLKSWYESLDKMRALKPDYFVMSHHYPLIGQENVYRTMTYYRDAVQLVHDQTVRFINQGLHPDEIANRITLTPQLRDQPYLQELYGTVRWSSKGLFAGYLGWFSGDISELDPLTPDERCTRIAQLAGGVDKLLNVADAALRDNDHKWSLYLSSCVVRVNPSSSKGKEMKAKALLDLAEQQTSFNGYNYYKTAAYTTLGTVEIKLNSKARSAAIMHIKMADLFYLLSLNFMSEQCSNYTKVIEFHFPDTKQNIKFQVRNGIVDLSGIFEKEAAESDVVVTVDSIIWRSIVAGEKSGLLAAATSEIQVVPGITALKEFIDCLEKQH